MKIRLPLIAIAVLLAAGAFAPPRAVQADAHTYVSTRRQVKVGILTSSALEVVANNVDYGSENPDPHFFYVLDSRSDVKPLGLEFVNPLAPPVITGSIYDRWAKRVRGTDPAFVAGSPQSKMFQIGAKVTKNMGAYWEVSLDNVTAQELQQFDLLFITSHISGIAFSADQREKLRKFIDGGGTLFVENCGRMSFDNNAPFFFDVNFHSGTNGNSQGIMGNQNHPLLSDPYIIAPQDMATIGDKYINDYYIYRPDLTVANDTGPGPDNINPPSGGTLVPIVWNTRGTPAGNAITPGSAWRPYIMAGQLGSGRIVFSAADVGCAVNDYVGGALAGYGGNSGAISGDTLLAAHPTDLKFMYNMVLWSTAHQTVNTDSRKSGGTSDRPGAKLAEKWAAPQSNAGSANVGGPCFFKHCVFTVDGSFIMHCYDALPGTDLDGDGNTDEGIPDFALGRPYDEVWNFDLKQLPEWVGATGVSSPTAIEFYDPDYNGSPGIPNNLANFKHRELIIVVLSNGTVVAVRAFPRLAQPGFPYAPVTGCEWVVKLPAGVGSDYNITNPSMQIPAATWSEGVVFVGLNTVPSGQVAAIDPFQGASAFNLGLPIAPGQGMVPGDVLTSAIGPVISSPAVGYVRDVASGANDKMVYVYVQRRGIGNVPDAMQGFPFGTKGEPLTRQGSSNAFTSRSSGTFPPVSWYMVPDPNGLTNRNPLLKQRVYATYKDPATGRVFSAELKFDLTGAAYPDTAYIFSYTPGQPVRITLKPQVKFGAITKDAGDENLTVYADYTLDWSTVFAAKVKSRSSLFGPQDVGGGQSALGGAPALSNEDLLYFTADTSGAAANNNGGRGVLFGASEQGSNKSVLKWAYTMHDGFTVALDDGTTRQILPRLRFLKPDGAWPGLGFPNNLSGDTFIRNVQFFGTPAVRNGVVYAVAHGDLGASKPSIICAFRANPELKLSIGQGIDRNVPIQIRQVNPVTQQNLGNQAPITLPQQNYTVDYASGIVRINSMAFAGGTNGFFSTSIPFQVKVGNAPEFLVFGQQVDSIDPDTLSPDVVRMVGPDGVDNLLWYMVIPPTLASTGDPIGQIFSSPSVQGDVLFVATDQGYVLAVDADPASNDPIAQAAGSQIKLQKLGSSDNSVEHLRWVQFAGHLKGDANPEHLRLRNAPVGTVSVMAIASSGGVTLMEDTRTVVADNKRIIEVNAAGDAVWSCDGTRSYGVAGGGLPVYFDPITGQPVADSNATGVAVQQRVAWSRPQVARRVNNNNLLVVDSGNNRVVEIDRGGGVIWEVNRMQADMLLDVDPNTVGGAKLSGMYRQGDPLTLNEPTDCLNWTEFVPNLGAWMDSNGLAAYGNANVPGYVLHYLVADTGNFRVVEIVDVLDSGGQPLTVNTPRGQTTLRRQLLFVSSSYPKLGKRYRYRSLTRISLPNNVLVPPFSDPNKPANAFIRFTLALVQNYRLVGDPNAGPGTAVNTLAQATESGGGSIMVLNEAGDPISIVSNLRIPLDNTGTNFNVQPIVNPVWFSKFDEYDAVAQRPVFKYLLIDANGCYQMKNAIDPITKKQDPRFMDVEWTLSTDDYYFMTGKKLNASSIVRLNTAVTNPNSPNFGLHHFLIANRFSGEDNPAVFGITFNTTNNPNNGNISGTTEFHGEVFEIDPTRFSWFTPSVAPNPHGYQPDYIMQNGNFLVPNTAASIIWRSPSEPPTQQPVPGLQIGVIIRSIGTRDRATATSLLEQPAFADRPF